ncbi:penicillin-binding protein 1A [Candidatus Magnetominusculus xianensis]|uniref:Penicillin-binding protein 1A n=1 Tax=Candidatus Magnetominusculus xianensis TaxID=1748249 RepID=A0ABR5SFJ6_9BACT|nr:PBP1A family penicillin-binding protein [Candidatus Magnetominusculus xianensis]KWT86056.1 penicillin-binding protein 1A [Candidatus Magnetominusculus xianensis]MBF0404385.1 PBP1A family penicillin-binding protein [Nitrospirota bacterium]
MAERTAEKTVAKKKAKTSKASIILPLILIVIAVSLGFFSGYLFWAFSDLPKIRQLEQYAPLESSIVYSADNEILAELFVERRTFVPYFSIPQHVKNAFIAVEDARFYKHSGIDFVRIVGAMIEDIKAGGFVQGGSTITQQLAKMLFLKPERSINRKVKEAALSIQIERHYTKDEIIGLYLNQAYFGTRAYGIEAAAFTYFGKTASNLSIAEAALLSAIPKAPSTYSPFKNAQKSLNRRNYAIRKMLENGFIDERQHDAALKEPLPTIPHTRKYKSPYFLDYVKNTLEDDYDEKLYTAGLKIYTTLDYRLQRAAEHAVDFGVSILNKRGRKNVQAALLAVDLKTGGIKAMVGGTDFWETQFNRVTQAVRQPGSSFKPIVYLAAFNQGFSPEDVIYDGPISFTGRNKADVWVPQNYEREYRGDVPIRFALAHSLNAATVYLADKVGIKNVIETAKMLGIKSTIQPYMPSALGASDMTLLELVYAYAAFATGKRFDHLSVERIVDRDGLLLEEQKAAPPKAILDNLAVEEMKTILRAVITEGTGRAAMSLPQTVYGKTGTTDDYVDAWFLGFDNNLAVGVWVGRDNHRPIGEKETGAHAALPIWMEFMKNE